MGDDRHLPTAAPVDAYGNGGFRFAGMSHRGSLLCLPDGIWACPVTKASEIDERILARVFENTGSIRHCLIGTGADLVVLPKALRQKFRDSGIAVETMATGAAVRTYNILLGENRSVAALLVAVE